METAIEIYLASLRSFCPKLTDYELSLFASKLTFQELKKKEPFIQAGKVQKAIGFIDYEIPLEFAEIARRNGVARMVLLSAYGASPQSKVFYSRIKGELEEKMKGLAFEKLIIFRPGLLLRKNTDRLGERISASVIQSLNSLGLIRKFRPLPTSILAEKLSKAPKVCSSGTHVVQLDEIFQV